MADVLIAEGSPVEGVQRVTRYKDMGDGTHARVVAGHGLSGVTGNGTAGKLAAWIDATALGDAPDIADTQIVFSDAGVLTGDSGATYDGAGTATFGTGVVSPLFSDGAGGLNVVRADAGDGNTVNVNASVTNDALTTTTVSFGAVATLAGADLVIGINPGGALLTFSGASGDATFGYNLDAASYSVGGTPGLASFNGAVTNITVVNGIVTAAS